MDSGGYYQGSSVDAGDAEHFGASWKADELIFLRDMWRRADLSEIARRLGRTEKACYAQYYMQLDRPEHERFTPSPLRHFEARSTPSPRGEIDTRPVRTIHDDEDRWWEPDYYKRV